MIWNEHYELKGKHASFSPSNPSWMKGDFENMMQKYVSSWSTTAGTIIHQYCADHIEFMEKLSKTNKKDIRFELLRNGVPPCVVDRIDDERIFEMAKAYVNDSIGFHMKPEQPLFYSQRFFGTADAISFKNKTLRIHDFKSGTTPAKIEQLFGYAALFCLEYDWKPVDIDMELRIYQSPEVLVVNPDASDILPIMDIIVTGEKRFVEMEG